MPWERDRCTCGPYRYPDGSYGDVCAYCENAEWEATWGMRDEDLQALLDGEAAPTRGERLAAMGEAEDSLLLGGCGGGERDPDLEWY